MQRILLLILVIAFGNNTGLYKQFLRVYDNRLVLIGSELNKMTLTFRTA